MTEFNKEKFSYYVMNRPHLGRFEGEEQEGYRVFKYCLDKMGCGDAYELYFKVDAADKVVDAKYITFGCGFAQATCGALIDSILNEDLHSLSEWTEDRVGQAIEGILGEFPVHKKAYITFAKQLLDGVLADAQSSASITDASVAA